MFSNNDIKTVWDIIISLVILMRPQKKFPAVSGLHRYKFVCYLSNILMKCCRF